jgi:hypothetical protein
MIPLIVINGRCSFFREATTTSPKRIKPAIRTHAILVISIQESKRKRHSFIELKAK